MAFHISGFLQQMVSGTKSSESASTESAAAENAGQTEQTAQVNTINAKYLASLLAGDTVTGVVNSMKDNQVILSLPNGENLFARLAQGAQVQLGQSMTFQVQENKGNFVALKPLFGDAQQMVLVQKALEAAGLSANESNMAIVQELLARNMSIDAAMLNEMVKNNLKFPNASLDTMANLVKLNIPVTQENIEQYEAYTHYERNMAGQLDSLPSALSDTLTQLTGQDPVQAGTFLKNVTAALYEGLPQEMQAGLSEIMPQDAVREGLAQKITETFNDTPQGGQAQALAEQITEGNATVKETLSQLADLIAGAKNIPDDTQAAGQTEKKLTQLLASKELGQLLKGQIEETLYLKPQMADSEESIKGFYKRVRSSLEAVSKETQKAAEGSALSANLNEIKSNIDFMNDLNRNMTYFQMPVRFSEGTGNGELYVFTNKKILHNNPENVSALLHLDMEHLGPVDVYVKLAGKNVTTNFCLEDSETLDFVYDHIDRLNARLEALGYTAHFEMKLTQPQENFDFEKDFLQNQTGGAPTSQYIFDIKA
jgi:hypothetical protein